jgi:hypothetical protein
MTCCPKNAKLDTVLLSLLAEHGPIIAHLPALRRDGFNAP